MIIELKCDVLVRDKSGVTVTAEKGRKANFSSRPDQGVWTYRFTFWDRRTNQLLEHVEISSKEAPEWL